MPGGVCFLGGIGRSAALLKQEFTVDLLLAAISEKEIPYRIRAKYCDLFLYLHVDTDPYEAVSPINYARLWSDIPDLATVDQYNLSGNAPPDMHSVIEFVREQVSNLVRDGEEAFDNPERNVLSHSIIRLAKSFVLFGCFRLHELLRLTESFVVILRLRVEEHRSQMPAPVSEWLGTVDDMLVDTRPAPMLSRHFYGQAHRYEK